MGQVHTASPVMPICAITTRYDSAFQWALSKFQSHGFLVAVKSDTFAFDLTDYYQEEMGDGLKKMILAFDPLRDPGEAADWKRTSNDWEVEYSQASEFSEARPLNLDPGYITLAKFVLLTTKDRDHRIYLRDGIFAEVTMSFSRGSWQPQRWTYPDYQLPEPMGFLMAAREALKKSMHC